MQTGATQDYRTVDNKSADKKNIIDEMKTSIPKSINIIISDSYQNFALVLSSTSPVHIRQYSDRDEVCNIDDREHRNSGEKSQQAANVRQEIFDPELLVANQWNKSSVLEAELNWSFILKAWNNFSENNFIEGNMPVFTHLSLKFSLIRLEMISVW